MSHTVGRMPLFYSDTGLSTLPFKDLNAQFQLTEEQFSELNEWLLDVEMRAAAIQRSHEENSGGNLEEQHSLPYYGTLAGGIKFSFIPVGMGVRVSVEEYFTGESLDLTDTSHW